jgi:DNA-binding GntR family transcriptional regulator
MSSKPTPDIIADALRAAILRGQFKDNEPLRQDKIAAGFGVSKVPVREALVQLSSEGLVTLHLNRGAFITGLSANEAREIYMIRAALEVIALEQSIPQMTPSSLVSAENVLRLMDIEANVGQWSALNWQFHIELYRAANLPHVLKILEPLHTSVARYLVLYLDSMGFQADSQREHYAILNACREQNTAAAVDLLKSHLNNASQTLVTFLQATNLPDNPTQENKE